MKTLALLIASLVLALFGFAAPARAATVINNGTDAELRAAVANCGTVTFNFDGVITLTNEIVVTCAVTIDATGHSVVLSGGNSNRLFQVQSNASLNLIHLKLANGRSTNAGGAIYNRGMLSAVNCGFLQNNVTGVSGTNGTNGPNGASSSVSSAAITAGSPGGDGSPGTDARGGAIFSEGSVDLRGCHFASNVVMGGAGGSGGRGGNGGRYPLAGPPLAGAEGANGGAGRFGGLAQGAAIASFGLLQFNGCTFSNSTAAGGVAGIGGVGGSFGGGVGSGVGGTSGAGGQGGGAEGSAVFAAGLVFGSNSLFFGNSAIGANGGNAGLPVSFGGQLGSGGSGGIAKGGAVYIAGATGLLANCTITFNRTRGGEIGTPGFLARVGDGIGGGIAATGLLHAANLTLHSNSASNGTPTCPGCGTNGNSLGGSIANLGGGLEIVNSILSGGFSNNCFGVITDLGHNLSSDTTPAWTSGTSLNNTDPLLLPLANYGGPTLTMALHAGSPALNTADCALAPATDQRGFPRPDGPGCDIGATEGATAPSLQIFRVNSSTNRLRWTAKAGRTYKVDGANSLNAWTPYSTNVAVTNGLLEVAVPVSAPARFFQLQAE